MRDICTFVETTFLFSSIFHIFFGYFNDPRDRKNVKKYFKVS